MRTYTLCFISLFGLISCQKEVKQSTQNSRKDSITEITYSTDPKDVLANKNTETLLDHLEEKQQELKNKLKTVNNKQDGDVLFTEYLKSFSTIIDSLNSTEYNTLQLYGNWNEANKPDSILVKEKRFKKLGMFIRNIDSNYYDIKLIPGFYQKMFKNKVSNELKDYLKLVAEYNQLNYDVQMKKTSFDLIKYRTLALDWENYMRKYPNSIYKDRIAKLYQEIMIKYLFGDKNLKTFDPVSKKFNSNIEQEYILLMKSYPKSKTAQITKDFMKYFYANDQVSNAKKFYQELQLRTIDVITNKINQ